MPKGHDYKTCEERVDKEGLVWGEKEQFDLASVESAKRVRERIEIF